MNVRSTAPALVASLLVLGACSGAASKHLQYDYGRAYSESINSQADLTRPSVANLEHPLAGVEAEAIRLRVKEAASDEETGESTLETGTQ